MLCVVIKGPSYQEAHQQIQKALTYADLVELRLDAFESLDESRLKQLRAAFSIPMIFTLRDKSQGGFYQDSEETRFADICRLAALKPEYFDLESHIPLRFATAIAEHHPEIKWIISYHDFAKTPHHLERIYQDLQMVPASFYKIAVQANTSLDGLRLLTFMKDSDKKVIGMTMGLQEQPSRILGPIFGSPITYASLDEELKIVPGQLTAQKLVETYHHRSLNVDTEIYGLIGDPVDRSISTEMHNPLMEALGLNAVYIKMPLKADELGEFFQLAKKLHFRGLSVTMPLKESLFPFLDHVDPYAQEIGAINTLVFEDDKILGFNTDAPGALNAIEAEVPVKGKKIVIIGAGGAAKAVVVESCRRGGYVTILNRHREKARQLADRFHGTGEGLEHIKACFEEGYDILINCTSHPMPIDPEYILPNALVMDIKTKPKETDFLKFAKDKGCKIVYGYKMFIEQGILQFVLWFKGKIDIQKAREFLQQKSSKVL
jgi:3-dehydroquinate dehydratase / shikimate dehydrogenase